MVDRCSAVLHSSIHGKLGHVHDMCNHSSFPLTAQKRSQNPSHHGIWSINYGPIRVRTQNVTWKWNTTFFKRQRMTLNFSAISLLLHQAYLLSWPGLTNSSNYTLYPGRVFAFYLCLLSENQCFVQDSTSLHHLLSSFNTTPFSFPYSHTTVQNWHLLFSASTLLLWKILGACVTSFLLCPPQ